MPDATVNIGGDASGALAAIGEVKAAIAGLTGKTVNVDVNVRQNGGGGGMSGAARDMEKLGSAAERAQQHMDRLNGSTNKVHNSVGKLGDKAGAASDHVGRLGDSSRDTAGHVETLGHSSAGTHDSVSQLGTHAKSASGSVGGLGTRANTASGHIDKLGVSATNAHDPLQRLGGLLGSGGSSGGGGSGVGGALGGLAGAGMSSIGALKGVGLAAGISAVGMGALSAAVAGVGLAGVAEDFAHNNQLMHAGQQALQGFNKEFSKMKGETTAAGSGPMAGVASSMKGVGHELAAIGAANIGPVMNDVSSLGNQATAAMHKLAPSIGPATQGLTALAGAVIGAFGDSGPAVESFANSITKNAPQIQALTSSVINAASTIGSFTVGAASVATDVGQGIQKVAGAGPNASNVADAGRSNSGSMDLGVGSFHPFAWMANRSMSPLSAVPNNGVNPLSLDSINAGPRAGAGAAPVAAGHFDPSKPFSGQLANDNAGTSFTAGQGDGAAPGAKPVRTRPGNFDSKGAFGLPTSPLPGQEGGSPDAAQFSGMTAGQVLTSQRASAGLPPVGQPHWDGTGPRGPGQSAGIMPMPQSAAIGMGAGPIAPLNAMQSALAQTAGSGGAQTGQSMVQHIQKAVQTAAPAATAGGASLGAGMNAGMAQGQNSSQTVTDTVTIKHMKHVIDIASAALGIHSPSTEFDWLGRMTSHGYAQGIERESHRAGQAAVGLFGQAKSGYDYQDGSAPTISVRRQSEDSDSAQQAAVPGAMQYSSPLANSNIQAHNDRAAQLASGRANLHAIAMANLGAINPATGQKWQDPRKADSNPFAGAQSAGQAYNKADAPGATGGPLAGAKGVWGKLHQSEQQPGQQGLPRVGPGSSGAPMSQLNASKLGIAGLPGTLGKAGENSALSLAGSMNAHVGKIQAAGGRLAGAGHVGYRKKDKQSSPSAEWAAMAGNSVAGAVGAMNAGIPAMAAAGAGAAGAMQAATAGPMADSGLAVGYVWAQNVETGISTQIKKANYQSLGLPAGLGQAGMLGLGKTGFLSAGSGASGYKTPGNAPGVVSLPAPQPITIVMQPHDMVLDGQVLGSTVQQQFSVLVDQLTGLVTVQPTS